MCRRKRKHPDAEPDEVRILTPEADTALELAADKDNAETPPEMLTGILDEWLANDLENRGRPVSFTELLMGDAWDLDHPAWQAGNVPEVAAPLYVATRGTGVGVADPAALVQSFFAGQSAM